MSSYFNVKIIRKLQESKRYKISKIYLKVDANYSVRLDCHVDIHVIEFVILLSYQKMIQQVIRKIIAENLVINYVFVNTNVNINAFNAKQNANLVQKKLIK